MSLKRLFLASIVFAMSSEAFSHHSTAEFDYSKDILIEGQIVEVQWMNPHSFIEVLAPGKDGAEAVRWSIEFGSPNINRRMGWKKTSLKSGEKVIIHLAPTRDGKPRGTLRTVTKEDGKVLHGLAGLTKSDDKGAPLINKDAVKTISEKY